MLSNFKLNNPYLALLKSAWHYARQRRKRYMLIYFFFLINSLIGASFPMIWGMFVDHAQQDSANIISFAWMYVGIYFFLRFMAWVFHGPARVWEEELAFDIGKNFTDELYQKTLSLPVQWHQDYHSGNTIDRIKKATHALQDFFSSGFVYLYTFTKFIFSFLAIIYFAPVFGSIAVLMGVGIFMVIALFDKPYIAGLKELNEREHIVSSTLFDSLSNIITVITLRLEKRMREGLLGKIADVFAPFRKTTRINEWKWFTVSMCINLIYGIIILGYIYTNYVPGEVFLLGNLVALVGYINRFTEVFHEITWQYTAIIEYNTDIHAAGPILKAYEELVEGKRLALETKDWRSIHIRNLNFIHQKIQSDKPAMGLHNIEIAIHKGQKIALVGESGSGKSTLMALLRGLYQEKEGLRLEIDGIESNQLGRISKQVSLFPQEPEIFENTIAYNITLGLEYDQEELDEICRVVHFQEVIAQLPQGLQSSIREKGVNLSGGQKQRLALARGVFAARDAQIILLDEPTSSVDPKTELEIYARMFQRFEDKAVISSLHRMHLLDMFDHIVVMEHGHIVAQGSFVEVYKRSAVFQELYQHQEA